MTVEIKLPRYVIDKDLKDGKTFYWNLPTYWKKQDAPFENKTLGVNLSQTELDREAKIWNDRLDAWRKEADDPDGRRANFGTIDWLFEEYKTSDMYLEKVSPRSRGDYEAAMNEVRDMTRKSGPRIGTAKIATMTPRAVDKLYQRFIDGGRGERYRTAEFFVTVCKRAWSVVHRLYPDLFDQEFPNPWTGVAIRKRAKSVKAAVTWQDVYCFARGAIAHGHPEAAAAAVIAYEFLQRPENIINGAVTWNDYRGPADPHAIRIEHYKTGQRILLPLDDIDDNGEVADRFYPEAEAILGQVPRRGIPIVLRADGTPFPHTAMPKLVRKLRGLIDGVPDYFTLDACRHGGMTELEEAEINETQGRALSGHLSKRSYRGYAKMTKRRALGPTKRRIAFRRAKDH